MKKVIETFMHDGVPFFAGMEVADDPALAWAEKRGLIVNDEPKAKEPAKKPAPTKKKK